MPDPLVKAHLEYLRQCGRSARTIYQRNRSLIRLAAVLPVPLIQATSPMLAEWRAALTCGEEGVKHYIGDAREFYRWAVDQDLRPDNPAAKLPVPSIGRRLPRPISEDDVSTALAAPPARVRPWLVLAGWAGLRAKEIAFLRRQHVLDTAQPPVLLIVHDATKGRTERIIPMSVFVIDELHRHGLPRSGWVFRRHDGRPGPNSPHLVSRLANLYLHSLGIDATLHQWRHRYGTQGWQVKKDLRALQETMGHADPKTTTLYTLYNQPDAVEMVEALPVPRRMRPAI